MVDLKKIKKIKLYGGELQFKLGFDPPIDTTIGNVKALKDEIYDKLTEDTGQLFFRDERLLTKGCWHFVVNTLGIGPKGKPGDKEAPLTNEEKNLIRGWKRQTEEQEEVPPATTIHPKKKEVLKSPKKEETKKTRETAKNKFDAGYSWERATTEALLLAATPLSRQEWIEKTDSLYQENKGAGNLKEAARVVKQSLRFFRALNILHEDDNHFSILPLNKK